jgi:hypothetical protein
MLLVLAYVLKSQRVFLVFARARRVIHLISIIPFLYMLHERDTEAVSPSRTIRRRVFQQVF